MTITAATRSTLETPARVSAIARINDPIRLTEAELDVIAAGGGGAGINPSRTPAGRA